MNTLRPAAERGHANHGWLRSAHTFSFADYRDDAHMSFRALRVINEDHVAAGEGFPTHPHRDMEIITYVLSGAVAHKDSTGGEGHLRAFRESHEIQAMSAGSGVAHSEFNPLAEEELHLLQIWLLPNKRVPAEYRQHKASAAPKNSVVLLASGTPTDGAAHIYTDAALYAGQLDAGQSLTAPLALGYGWLQLARGSLTANGQTMRAGDGLAITAETAVNITASTDSEFLLFDLA